MRICQRCTRAEKVQDQHIYAQWSKTFTVPMQTTSNTGVKIRDFVVNKQFRVCEICGIEQRREVQ